MSRDLRTVLDFMTAAQTTLAVYGSPNGPIDPLKCYEIMVELLEDPKLLEAQIALQGHGVVMILGEQSAVSLVL